MKSAASARSSGVAAVPSPQRGREALDGGDGGPQLVGDVGQELALAHVGGLEPRRHAVEGLAEPAELVVGLLHPRVEVAPGDGLGAVGEVADRAAQP